MKSGHTIQLLLSWMITWISAKFQALGMLLLCLLFLMFIDYITGMLASRKEGIDHPDDVSYGWRSQKGFWGIIKKTGCWMVIASAFSVDELLLHSAKSLGITYPGNLYLGVFVTVWYSLNEVLSIIENAGRMGVPIPQELKTYISILKKKLMIKTAFQQFIWCSIQNLTQSDQNIKSTGFMPIFKITVMTTEYS